MEASLQAGSAPTPAARPAGMGPIVLENAVAFRVWAPHADRVSVIGSFNDWSNDADPMQPEDGGCWFALIPDARPGDQYKYRIVRGDTVSDRIDPRVREVTHSVGSGVIHDPSFDWEGDRFSMPPWNELVIYECHIGTFSRGENKWRPGTFDDFCKRLDHLQELGINAIQIMPIAEFAGDWSWGYNPAHPYAIESVYGGPVGFKRLVKQAHRAGLAVILDVVYNHFGPSDLDLWRFDGWYVNDKGGIYFYNDNRSQTPWGDTRPDYGRGEVRSYIRDNAMMWLEDYHVDGLRFDMTLFIRSVDGSPASSIPDGWGLTQWINREVKQFKPQAITIAEDLQNNAYLTKPVDQGGAGFCSQWDANFVHPVRHVITQVDDSHRSMQKIRDAVYHRYNEDAFGRVIYTESHDEVANGKARVPSEINREDSDVWYAQKRAALGAFLTMTAPGIPMLFQGQEFLEDGWFQDTEPLNWDYAEEYDGIVDLYARLIRLRRNATGKTRGLTGQHVDVYHVNDHDKVVALRRFDRGGPGDDVVVLLNFRNHSFENYRIGMPRAGTWIRRCSTDNPVYIPEKSKTIAQEFQAQEAPYDGQPCSIDLSFGEYSALILSQDPPSNS